MTVGIREGPTIPERARTPILSCRDLRVWREAVSLTTEVYRVTALFPSDERYGLVSQARRAAVSVAANIAEGHGRDHLGD
jgi:hypothetical protein